MRFWTYVFISVLTACSAAKQKDQSRKDSTVEQPTEVSGGFGLTMQCSVLNREVVGATASEVGCVVNNDDGTKYTGTMKNLSASITAKGQTGLIQATPTVADASSSLSVGVSVPGLKPGDAISIAINGVFDEKPAILTATLKGRFSVVCDEDLDLYVKVNAPATNLACTKEAPCAKISQAVQLLPDVFNCKVNVYLAPESNRSNAEKTFYDQISIHGKEVTSKGGLKFEGTTSDFDEKTSQKIVIKPDKNLQRLNSDVLDVNVQIPGTHRIAVNVTSFGISQGASAFTLRNIEISGNSDPAVDQQIGPPGWFDAGIAARTSKISLINVDIRDVYTALALDQSSLLYLKDITIDHALVGMNLRDSIAIATGHSRINGGPTPAENKSPGTSPIIENSVGLYIYQANLSTENLEISNFDHTVDLLFGSNFTISELSSVNFNHTRFGINAEDSKFMWTLARNKPVIDKPWIPMEPSFAITDCQKSCVQLSNSYFTIFDDNPDIGTSHKPKLSLKADLQTSSANLISAYRNSVISISRVQNDWCDASGNTLLVVQDSTFNYFRRAPDEKPVRNPGCSSNRQFINYGLAVAEDASTNSCQDGWLNKGPSCYAQFGFGFITTDSPATTTAIPTGFDISKW